MKPSSPLACCKPKDERPIPSPVFKQQYTTENGKVKMTMPVSPMHYIVSGNYYANDMRRPVGPWDYSVPQVDRAVVNPIGTHGTVRDVYVHEHPAHCYYPQPQRRVITPTMSMVHENNKRQGSIPIHEQFSTPAPVLNNKPSPRKQEKPMVEVAKVEELFAKLNKRLDTLETCCRRNEAEITKLYDLIMELSRSIVSPVEQLIAANASFSDKQFTAVAKDVDAAEDAKPKAKESVATSRASSRASVVSISKRSARGAAHQAESKNVTSPKPAAQEEQVPVEQKVLPRVAKPLHLAATESIASVSPPALIKERKVAAEKPAERPKAREVPRRPKLLEIGSGRTREPEAAIRVERHVAAPVVGATKPRVKSSLKPVRPQPQPLPLPHAIEYTKPVQKHRRAVEEQKPEVLWPAISDPKIEHTETNTRIVAHANLAVHDTPSLQAVATLEEDVAQEAEGSGFMALDDGENASEVEVEELPAASDLSVLESPGTSSPEESSIGSANVAGLSKDQAKEWLKRCQEELLLLQAESAASQETSPQPAVVEYPDFSESADSFGDVVVLKSREFEDAVDDFATVQLDSTAFEN